MYYSDMPINSKKQDVLNRANFAKMLANALIEYKDNETFTVGLFGKWGCGKTSLVNLTLSEIEDIQKKNAGVDGRLIVVHFNPWNFSSTDQLLTQFFIRLSNEFKETDEELKNLSSALEKYSAALSYLEWIPQVGTPAKVLSKIVALFSNMTKKTEQTDVHKQKELIEEMLEQQSNHILVVIDDIDRLPNEQIRYIFQLITSVANFPNTMYLLVFDKEIVVNALSEVQTGNGEQYLEKIIQMPISVPEVRKVDLHKFLFDRLDSILEHYNDMIFEESHWQSLFEFCVAPFIKQLRDVNRLYNALKFKLSAISSEVNYVDMIAVSVLEIKHPLVYEWILNNKSLLTGEKDISEFLTPNKKTEDLYETYFYALDELVKREYPAASQKEQETMTEIVIKSLAELFPDFGRRIGEIYEVFDSNLLLCNNRIAHYDKFDRYFELNMDTIVAKRGDVTTLIHLMPECEIVTYLLEQDAQETSYELLENIKARIEEFSEQRAKCFVTALFKSICQLGQIKKRSVFSISAGSYAEFIILDLFERIPQEHRKDFWVEIINSSDADMISSIASVIEMIELAYGRLSAEGKPRNYKRIVTEAELPELELCILKRIQKFLSDRRLFDLKKWQVVLRLLISFDPENTAKYLEQAFEDDVYILQYISSFVSECRGAGCSYEVQSGYEEYLTDERISKAIMNCKKNRKLFELPLDVKHKCAAFELYRSNIEAEYNKFEEVSVKELLESWEREAISS